MKSEPHGIFEIVENKVPIHSVNKTLDRLLNTVDEVKQGYENGLWSWEEILLIISNYITIMKSELKNTKEDK